MFDSCIQDVAPQSLPSLFPFYFGDKTIKMIFDFNGTTTHLVKFFQNKSPMPGRGRYQDLA